MRIIKDSWSCDDGNALERLQVELEVEIVFWKKKKPTEIFNMIVELIKFLVWFSIKKIKKEHK